MSGGGQPLSDLSAVKLALMAKQVRSGSEPLLRADPIAIVGMGCRVPGGGDTPQRFWDLLCAGVDATREVPADRWDGDAWRDPDVSAVGKSVTHRGGFLDRIDGFDAPYFGILPREAERMDPQQRLFLEVAIEALDDAGLTRERLRGSRTGVFVASYHNDYAQMQYGDVDAVDARTLTGTLHSVLPNRLSYLLDLKGPSVSIDTACSSSLVAIHLACQSLRFGESDIAVAGGVSLIIVPELMVSMSKVGFMAPDGRCKTFDAHADGFGRGEGCGLVVLKRLSDAVADGDRVLAVIRGSAVNQDGHSTLLAAPHGPAQEALIREALASAQLSPGRIGYVEAHGTGTALGDPIEVEAIAAAVGRVPGAGACFLGSAKANLGHLEAAAGVTGLIKATLALRHEAVPPQVHLHSLSPHIALGGTRLHVPTALTPWPRTALPRCSGISSFGVGGTNAHVILEEAPRAPPTEVSAEPAVHVLPLSAQSPAALADLARGWIDFLSRTPDSLEDVCFTAVQRRTHYAHRLAVVGRSREDLAARLADYSEGRASPGLMSAARAATDTPRIAFVFSGQGPQWHAMGRELLATEPVFRDVLTECDALLKPLSGWSLLEELARSESQSRLNETEVAQPALFGLQVALAALWKSWGVEPCSVAGHSVGEIAALHVAGVLDLQSAVHVVWHRGRIMQQATGLGRMASVALTENEATDLLRRFGAALSIAAVNAPRSVVLSGDSAALELALAELTNRGINHRLLPVQYAFHSAQMEPFRKLLGNELRAVRGAAPSLGFYSTVSGTRIVDEAIDSTYFARNVREPVRFASAVSAMLADGCDVVIEIGPHPVLASAIAECVDESTIAPSIVASLRRNQSERETMLRACAAVHVAGGRVDWEAVQAPGQVVTLPGYPWQRQRYWLRKRPVMAQRPGSSRKVHPLLGTRVSIAGLDSHIYEASHAGEPAWLADHRIFGRLLMPAAAVLEMFTAAATRALGSPDVQLLGFAMSAPLFLPEAGAETLSRWQVSVSKPQDGRVELQLFEAMPAAEGGEQAWRNIASCSATALADEPRGVVHAGVSSNTVGEEAVYQRFNAIGVEFGPTFRCLSSIRHASRSAAGSVALPESLESRDYALHPVLIDAALQLCSVAASASTQADVPEHVFLPLGADRVVIRRSAASHLQARASIEQGATGETLAAAVTLETERGDLVLSLEGMRFARATPAAFAAAPTADDLTYEVSWQPAEAAQAVTPANVQGLWLAFADRGGVADAIVARIEAAGGECVRVVPGTSFARSAQRTWSIDPEDRSHFERLLAESGWSGAKKRGGVLHCWALDTQSFDGAQASAIDRDDGLAVASSMHLVQALAGVSGEPSGPVWFITRGAQVVSADEPAAQLQPSAAGAWGLAGVAALEHPELQVRVLDLDPSADSDPAEQIFSELRAPRSARAAVRGKGVFVPRLRRRRVDAAAVQQQARRLRVARPGTFDGVELEQTSHASPLRPDEVRLRVLAAGLNFRDVLVALGMYPGAAVPPLGAECAGEVLEVGSAVVSLKRGDRVFGYATGSLGSEVNVSADFLARVPDGVATDDAAGLAVAFLTAYYGLHNLAGLQRGERVLIHAAAGGVGLAAVQLAKRRGAEVFATAGSPEKREFLRSLGVAQVFDSRTLSFSDEVLAATGGQGVHVVLNSLAGDFIPASLRTLGSGGRFLEIGKRDVWSAEAVRAKRPDVRYWVYDLGSEAQSDRSLLRPMFADIAAGLSDGSLRPLPVRVFPLEQAREAMRFMAQARHIGKIVLRVATDGARGIEVSDAGLYLITGAFGGLGLLTARWLVERGARHLMLVGRRAPTNEAQQVIRELEGRGARVYRVAADVTNCSTALAEQIRSTGRQLRGVIHSAGALHDGVLASQQWAQARSVLGGKAHGGWFLHELTRNEPLDFFVLYSAAGALLGASGQGLYGAANWQLDALAQARRRAGLPALSVAWGAWAGAGMAAKAAAQGRDIWADRGVAALDAATAFNALERLVRDGAAHAAVVSVDWQRFLGQLPPGAEVDFFAGLARSPGGTGATSARPAARANVLEHIRTLPASQRRDALCQYLMERIRQVLGLDASVHIDPRLALKDIGLDSLMAVELRNSLNHSAPKPLPATLLFDYPTLDALTGYLAKLWALEEAAQPAPSARAAAPDAAGNLVKMSEAEAEALLLAELEALQTERES